MDTVTTRRRRDIRASAEQLWHTLAALDRISSWAPNVEHSTYTTVAHQGIGAARRVQVGPIALIETVCEWLPCERLSYSIVGLPPLVRRVTNRWDLEPRVGTPGQTRVTLTTTIDPGATLTGKLAAAVLVRVLGRASAQLLAGLAAHHARGAHSTERAGW